MTVFSCQVYRIAVNIEADFNLTLWRFKHQIAKNKTVEKLIKFVIHCVPFIAHHCWREASLEE